MKKPNFFQVIRWTFALAGKYLRKNLFIAMTFLLLGSVVDGFTTIFNVQLFDKVELVVGGAHWMTALPPLIFSGLSLIANRMFFNVFNSYWSIVTTQGKHSMQIPLNEACGRMEPAEFENPETLDAISKAVSGSAKCTDFVMCLLYVLTDLPYVILMGSYFYTLRPVLTWTVLFAFLPVLLTQILKMTVFRKLEDDVAPLRRENDYYDRCISHRDFFKETRLLGAYRYFAQRFQSSLQAYCKASSKTEVRSGVYSLISDCITLLGYLASLYLLFDSVMGGYISIGAFAGVFSTIGMIINSMELIIQEDIGTAAKHYGAVQNFVAFISAKPQRKKTASIKIRGNIQLRDVRFSYPGAQKETIKGITFTIQPGETLAVVGENGAGKSTLMRLITGQYLPTAGSVIVDGRDLSELDMESRFANVSAVFQKFGRYRMTVDENITLSSREGTEAEMLQAARHGDVHLDDERSFPDGKNTMLSREFGGVDLSGGQWQRVAVARGLYRSHDLVILDEPTAAIDPIEETKLYKRFSDISEGKTAIIVTHRLGSARIADRILVMKDGLIDDVGTHDELIAKGGYYAELYKSQAEWYVS